MVGQISRAQVLTFRVCAQQLDRGSTTVAASAALDIGVQDTGPDGGLWALAIRGVDVSSLKSHELVTVWSVRGAPHRYRRGDLPSVAAAVEPFSDADAGKRIYDAAKPLKAAGIANLVALDWIAAAMRSVVAGPMLKGDVSARVAELADAPYLRSCRPCNATHLYEMPFRLSALRAALELQAGTSPPMLTPIPGFAPMSTPSKDHEIIRAYLRLLGPATPRHVASYLDAALKDVKARWPSDAVEVSVDGETRWVLAADKDRFGEGPTSTARLLGPFDLFLQARDRSLLVDDPTRAKALWPVLGRPGAVLVGDEIVGTWRPRKSGMKLTVRMELWTKTSTSVRGALTEQAERLAAYRQVRLSGIDFTS
ncbi:MAG: winged helix DNA-binding domain-containing protein [Actinomycetota bacterium]|nr:winged helix DNA-binding domain-containing protein [Actinomycetota bacterium]